MQYLTSSSPSTATTSLERGRAGAASGGGSPSQRKARRKSVSRDIRIALNTIRQSVNMVQKSGMNVIADEQDKGNYYEVIIRIPK